MTFEQLKSIETLINSKIPNCVYITDWGGDKPLHVGFTPSFLDKVLIYKTIKATVPSDIKKDFR